MLILSLLLNIAVTFTVAATLFTARRGDAPFGPDTPARRILACIYVTIGGASLVFLALILVGQREAAIAGAVTLLSVQIAYKLGTLLAVGPWNPVVLSNLAIAAVHGVTLATLL